MLLLAQLFCENSKDDVFIAYSRNKLGPDLLGPNLPRTSAIWGVNFLDPLFQSSGFMCYIPLPALTFKTHYYPRYEI